MVTIWIYYKYRYKVMVMVIIVIWIWKNIIRYNLLMYGTHSNMFSDYHIWYNINNNNNYYSSNNNNENNSNLQIQIKTFYQESILPNFIF